MTAYFEREKTVSTPYVLIDAEKKFMKISGRCFHENITEVFEEIKNRLDVILAGEFGAFTLECAFDYVNSTTAKILLNMFMEMDGRVSDKNRIVVNWISDEDNDIMIECGEDFKNSVERLEFNIIENAGGENE